ncbi:MAG: methyltransferase domain-containing protein, partial [Planctomycetota bacterium]|nr:methyltransferase domain-containing protein [Planctomycetota bacterium]
ERARNAEAFFGRVGGEWDQIRTQLFGRAFTAEALAALADPSWTVADLGCGTGDAASLLAASVKKVIAVDREPAMLRAARKRLEDTENVDFHAADLESLPLETASVDVAFILLVLHHLEDPQKAVNEAARILKPKGTLVVVDMTPHERKEYRELMAHRHLGFSADQLKEWTKHCPLDLAHSRPLRPDPNAAGPGLFVARFSRRENA